MYIRNDGKGESNITQNGFTAYLLSAVAHRKADYLHAKQRRQAREVLTDPDDLSSEEVPGISDPTDVRCCIGNAASARETAISSFPVLYMDAASMNSL